MSQDKETISFYEKEAASYVQEWDNDLRESKRFMDFAERLLLKGDVLDLGCGGGRAAKAFNQLGFSVTAFDASEAMIAEVQKIGGVKTICADFDGLDIAAGFDGIWANYCLQHVPRGQFPSVLDRVANALRNEGWLLIGLHEGTETRRDKLGRLYCHHTEAELTEELRTRGIEVQTVAHVDSVGYDGTPFTGMTIVARKTGGKP